MPLSSAAQPAAEAAAAAKAAADAAASTPVRSSAAYDGGSSLDGFISLASERPARMLPLWRTLFGDQLTPVLAYRCLVDEGQTDVPSFLLESVNTKARVGRYSMVGARPVMQVMATAMEVTIVQDYFREDDDWVKYAATGATAVSALKQEISGKGQRTMVLSCDDPWALIRKITEEMKANTPASIPGGSGSFSGGWVGYGGYDTMRYAEISSLPFEKAPVDDRGLPDLHFGLYRDIIVFDHVAKVVFVIHWVDLSEHCSHPLSMDSLSSIVDERRRKELTAAHAAGMRQLDELSKVISRAKPLSPLLGGTISLKMGAGSASEVVNTSNMTRETFNAALDKIHQHIIDGDAFQVVFSQRFERWSRADPFSAYRALRVINPSPYMIYMQCAGSTLVASSPEILCRVLDRIVTNRPLAGTRPRGRNEEEDLRLEAELLADPKDTSEHVMLVDLGRNDVGRVAKYGSVKPLQLMEVERYSNVMHISSTIVGELQDDLASWDALRAALPAGTISGAPKIRAMQIIDDLEPTRRGPYGGGIGYISLEDTMNMALALRTMVIPHGTRKGKKGTKEWHYYLQAGAGIVLDSDTDLEYHETINKAMALNRAIDLAEESFR